MANKDLISYAKPKVGGGVCLAPVGTALPQDATTNLDEAFKDLGYISEDALTNENSPESEVIKAWGGSPVLVVQTEKEDTFTLKLIEILNLDVLKLVYNKANVSGELSSGITVKANSKTMDENSFVIDMILKKAIKRIVIPCGTIKEVAEIKYGDDDAVGYEVTILATANASGDTHYEYIVGVE